MRGNKLYIPVFIWLFGLYILFCISMSASAEVITHIGADATLAFTYDCEGEASNNILENIYDYDVANSLNVCSKKEDYYSFINRGGIYISNGTAVENGKTIFMNATSGPAAGTGNLFFVFGNATLNLTNVHISESSNVKRYYFIQGYDGANINLDQCFLNLNYTHTFPSVLINRFGSGSVYVNITKSVFRGTYSETTIENVIIVNLNYTVFENVDVASSPVYNCNNFYDYNADFAFSTGLGLTLDIYDAKIVSDTWDFYATGYTGDSHYVDVDCSWKTWSYGLDATLGFFHRQNTFNLNMNQSGVTVKIYNRTGDLFAEVVSGADGWITEQIINVSRDNVYTGLVWYSPYTFVINKTGYQTMTFTSNITEKTNWSMFMVVDSSGAFPFIVRSNSLSLSLCYGIAFGMLFLVVFRRRWNKWHMIME